MMGLPRAEALELAAQSELVCCVFMSCLILTCDLALQGAARMTLQQGAHPAQIKDTVTSKSSITCLYICLVLTRVAPGGCTIAGLLALEDGRVRSTIARAIQVATERASELGQPNKK